MVFAFVPFPLTPCVSKEGGEDLQAIYKTGLISHHLMTSFALWWSFYLHNKKVPIRQGTLAYRCVLLVFLLPPRRKVKDQQ